MKKICLAIALSFAMAAPVYACPSEDGAAKTAKTEKDSKDKADKKTDAKGTAQKPAETTKKAGDKVSMK